MVDRLSCALSLAMAAAALGGCAAEGPGGAPPPPYVPGTLPEPTHTCVVISTVTSWKALDYRRLVVQGGGGRYLIELESDCAPLRHAESLAFDAVDARVCDDRGDAVLVGGQRCRIGAIRRDGGSSEQKTP